MPTLRGLLTPAAGATVLVALGLTTTLVGGAAAAQRGAAAAPSVAPLVQPVQVAVARSDGFDPATCVPQPVTAGTAPTGGTSTGDVQVTLVVPPTTVISVDDRGRPVRVSTNTGQAPCITDQFLRVGADGLSTAADPALTTAVLSVRFGAGWAPGVPQVFPAG